MPSLGSILRQLPIRDLFSSDVIRDSHRASRVYDRQDTPRYPALQHQFFATFSVNTGQGYGTARELSFLIKRFTRPTVNIDTQELHQYNKRRTVQTGIHYTPLDLAFYDTNDRVIQQLFVDYNRWYYGDFDETKSDKSWIPDIVSPVFVTDGRGWGFSPNMSLDPAMGYFFDRIDLYDVSPDGSFVLWRLIHPIIESWTLGADDYTSGEQKEIAFTFRYEGMDTIAGHGQMGGMMLNDEFMLDEMSDHAELPGAVRSFLTNTTSIGRDIMYGTAGNIGARLGLPIGGILQGMQTGKYDPIQIGGDVVRAVKGASALSSFGTFIFGDTVSNAYGNSTSTNGFFGPITSGLGLFKGIEDQRVEQNNALPKAITGQSTESSVSGAATPVTLAKLVPSPGIDTNVYQAAQGLAQTTNRTQPETRDALAGAIVSTSKKTGLPMSDVARKGADSSLSLSSQALQEINRLKPASTQFGFRANNSLNPADPDARRLLAAKR